MKLMLNVFILIFLLVISCQPQEQKQVSEPKIEITEKAKEEDSFESSYWISEAYLQCIKKNLPCECISQAEFSVLYYVYNTSEVYVYEYHRNHEELTVKSIGDSNYEVYTNPNNPSPFFKMQIQEDTLLLIKNDAKYKYIKYSYLQQEHLEKNFVGQLNIRMLKERLGGQKEEVISSLEITNTTCFYCNKELGGVDLISNKGNCDNMWILENKDGKIQIYDYLNSCDAKTYPVNIKKELRYAIDLQ